VKTARQGYSFTATENSVKRALPTTQSTSDLVKAAGQGNSFTARENLIKGAIPTRQSPSDWVKAARQGNPVIAPIKRSHADLVEAARISNSRRRPPTEKKPAKMPLPATQSPSDLVKAATHGNSFTARENLIKGAIPTRQSPSDWVKAATHGNSTTATEKSAKTSKQVNPIKKAFPTTGSLSALVEAEDYQFEQNFDYNGHFADEEIHQVGNDDNDQFEQNFDYNGHFADEEIQEYEIDKKPY
jgi:plasmid stability protein